MKPRILKKGTNTDGTARYILQFIKKGEIKSIALNPTKLAKLLDSPNEKVKPSKIWTTKNPSLRQPQVNKYIGDEETIIEEINREEEDDRN